MNGKGTLYLPGEIIVKGTFKDNILHGRSLILFGKDVMVTCEFKNGRIDGKLFRAEKTDDGWAYKDLQTGKKNSSNFTGNPNFTQK